MVSKNSAFGTVMDEGYQRARRYGMLASRRIPCVSSSPETPVPSADVPAGASKVPDPLINMMIDGRYKVLSRMARGGMATVYVARDERLDRLVALKVMHPHLAESEQFTARFRLEARSAAKISHPGIVPIYDQGVVEGQGYLVMELISGTDLRTLMNSGQPLELGTALSYAGQILDALAAAHRAGVIHRDLKPENVLITDEGALKIVDFGLARAASEVSVSTTGSIMGTVAYLAPEVALNGTSDSRTDLFALGVMLYEMLTGVLPGGNDNPVQVALSRVNEDIPSPSAITEWLPTEVDDLVAALCARDAVERPASALDAAALLQQTLKSIPDEAIEKELPSPRSAARQTSVKDLTLPLPRSGRTSILPINEVVIQTSGSVTTPDTTQLTSRSRMWLILTTILLLISAIALGTWWWWQQYGPGSYLEVPDLSNMTIDEAEKELALLDLASSVSYDHSDDVTVDAVIRTLPAAGEAVHKSQEIEIVISKGILMLTVPDVVGDKPDKAAASIEAVGLEVGTETEEWSETVPAGIVIATQPEGGSSVEHFQPIDIVVSKGKMPIEVPDLTGTSSDSASAALEVLGLAMSATEAYSDEVPQGDIISQDPVAGETLHKSDTVSVVVSLGPEYVAVPDVYGRNADDARAILEEAGFHVEVNRLAGFFNSVGSQSPSGGESARRGSTVTITVV